LKGLLKDFDPLVAVAAADVIGLVTGERPVPQPTRRVPDQPTEDELRRLPRSAIIRLQDGITIGLRLLPDEAPLAVARFAKLARAHYFDNQMLSYRFNVLATASGGSPGANDNSGDARFLRDETGIERHTRGAVGLATHGRDTGDARFFIDLVDQPGFDFQYTVFARLGAMTPVDPLHPRLLAWNRLLEGGTILSMQLDVR
jgi:cyclophilin family peptidyl-prolyl cis-trans isomerase